MGKIRATGSQGHKHNRSPGVFDCHRRPGGIRQILPNLRDPWRDGAGPRGECARLWKGGLRSAAGVDDECYGEE